MGDAASREFARAKRLVDEKRTSLEHDVLRPLANSYRSQLESRPLITLYVTMYALFSFWPAVLFACFAGTTLVALTLASLAFVAFWSSFLIGCAALVLLGTLAIAAGTALVSVLAGIATYRLVVRMHALTSGSRTKDNLATAVRGALMDAAALRVQNTTNTTSEADSHDVVLVAAPKEG